MPTPAAPPTARRSHDRESILQGAVELFNERGYDGTTVDRLARHLGLRSKASLYHHVSGKEELLELAVNRALDALFAALEEEEARGGADAESAAARLERLVRRGVGVLAADLPYVTLLLRVRGNTAVERRALERRREFDRRVAKLVIEASAAGAIRRDISPSLVSRLMFGAVNSLIEWYRPDGELPVPQLADALTLLLFDGLGTEIQ